MLISNITRNAHPFLRSVANGFSRSFGLILAAQGRLRYFSPFPRRFTGAYSSFDEAIAAARSSTLAGYDHDEVAHVAFEKMCQVTPWDYPVLFWMRHLMDDIDGVVDAGGHMGNQIPCIPKALCRSTILPMGCLRSSGDRSSRPADGRARGVDQIIFRGSGRGCRRHVVVFGSGLMQYLDVSPSVCD